MERDACTVALVPGSVGAGNFRTLQRHITHESLGGESLEVDDQAAGRAGRIVRLV